MALRAQAAARGVAPPPTVRVEVTKAAQEAYNAALHARFPSTVWASGCKSWYTWPGEGGGGVRESMWCVCVCVCARHRCVRLRVRLRA